MAGGVVVITTPPSALDSRAARAWLCRLASGLASGGELCRFLVDDREEEGPRAGVQRYEAAAADPLLRWWEQEGVVTRGMLDPGLTVEQRINYGGRPEGYPSAYGYSPGPRYVAPEWTSPPRRVPLGGEPRWITAAREREPLAPLVGTRNADGFRLYVCPGGGILGREGLHPEGGKATCPSCGDRHPLRPGDVRVVAHVTPDYSSRVGTYTGSLDLSGRESADDLRRLAEASRDRGDP